MSWMLTHHMTHVCLPLVPIKTGKESLQPSKICIRINYKDQLCGFPGDSAVKNPSANARDMGSIPDPGDPTCHKATKPIHHTTEARTP